MAGYTTFTWSEIRQRLKDRLELKRFWTDDEVSDAFNETCQTWNLLTGYWKRRETITTVAGQYDYVLSADMLYRTRMTFNNLPMSPGNRMDLNNARPTWRSETTTSGGDVPTRPTVWTPISLELFYLWPADAAGGNTLTVDGVADTPSLVEDADTVDVGEELLTTLLGMALHTLVFKKGGPAFQSTMPLFQTFLSEAAELNGQIKTSQVYRRIMGLDRRDLKPLRGATTTVVGQAGGNV
jgi:hypothetical protein